MVVAGYLQAKENYESEAKKAQVQSWKEFCGKQDREGLWEGIYRVIGRTAKRHEDLPLARDGKVQDPVESVRMLAETFYPEDLECEDNADHRQTRNLASQVNSYHDEQHDPPFTLEELRESVESFNPKKAPGADGLTADICSHAISRDPQLFLAIANKCLELGHFPIIWKEATVIVLRKPGKEDYTNPKSYRPIGLLPVMGKILEKMFVKRLKWHLIKKMSTRQYGFMPQRSTEDSLYDLLQHIHCKLRQKKLLTIVSLDIEGAFDSAWWPAIRVRLAEEKCPINIRRMADGYLRDRTVSVRYAGEQYSKSTNKGCVQGSIGGPILWNLILDPLLKGLEQKGYYAQAFADDVVLVFDGDTALDVQRHANAALACVQEWGVKNKLTFAPHKTTAMVMTRKMKYDTPLLRMGGIDIDMSNEIKLLGVIIDAKLTWNSHVSYISKKAVNIYRQLSTAARVSWGLHPEVVRVIYTAVVEPVIMYASSIWASASKKLGIQRQLNAVQRGFAQKLCKAYRTVSLNSALVLAGILPLDLRIQEAAALYEAKRGVTHPALGGGEIEQRTAFTDTPHPARHMGLKFLCLVDQNDVDRYSGQAVQIFTDGSKIEGKVGAALSLWSNAAETKSLKLKLSSYCTVYQAELLAIYMATEEVLKSPEMSFGVYSDSRSSLESVVNSCSLHPLAVKIRRNLDECKNLHKKVDLFWVKAHAGLEGNERADELAKDAALKLKIKPHYDKCPISFVKRQIRMDTLDEWNRRYKSKDTAATTKLFLPDAVLAFKIVRKMELSGIITQILTGHGGFSEYLYRFKCKESPSCICEPDKDETVPHIIAECPAYGSERFEFEQKMDCKIVVSNLSDFFSDDKLRNSFVQYCLKVANQVIKKNK